MNAPVKSLQTGRSYQAGRAYQTGRRADSRLRLQLPAELITLDGPTRCRLENLSSRGAQLAIAGPLRIGKCGFLRCAGMENFGTVVWSDHAYCGVRFDTALSQQTLFAIRRMAETFTAEESKRNSAAIHDWVAGRSRIL